MVENKFNATRYQSDIDAIVLYMQILRSGGITPSSVLERGLDYSEEYVAEHYSSGGSNQRMLAANIWENAAKTVGVHAEIRKATKNAVPVG